MGFSTSDPLQEIVNILKGIEDRNKWQGTPILEKNKNKAYCKWFCKSRAGIKPFIIKNDAHSSK